MLEYKCMPRESRVVYPVSIKQRKPFPPKVFVILLTGVCVIMLAGAVWFILRLSYFRVDRIEVTGNRMLSAEGVAGAAREAIGGTLGRIIPQSNFFIISSETIERALRERFPSIESVRVSRRFPDRLLIRVSERTLWGVYCEQAALSLPPRSCAYLDTSGTAYAELSQFQGWLLPVIFGSGSVALGTAPIPPATLAFFGQARAALAAVNGELLAMRLSTSTPVDARLELAEGWELWVSTDRPIAEWSGVLQTVLAEEVGARRRELEYVDLRFGNKVFYKFR